MEFVDLDLLSKQNQADALMPADSSDLDILQPENLVQVVRGNFSMRDGIGGRYCKVELWLREPLGRKKPAGVFVCRGKGLFNDYETALLTTKNFRVSWMRTGNDIRITTDGGIHATMKLSWPLRLLFIGTAVVKFPEDIFCKVRFPVVGPSSIQRNDCTGCFVFQRDGHIIKFIINPGQKEPRRLSVSGTLSKLCSMKKRASFEEPHNLQSIFYPSDQQYLSQLSKEHLIILLAIAIWPISLYKNGVD